MKMKVVYKYIFIMKLQDTSTNNDKLHKQVNNNIRYNEYLTTKLLRGFKRHYSTLVTN